MLIICLVLISFGLINCNCPDSKKLFDCGNGFCVASFSRCDDDNDCGNWADEDNCGQHQERKKPKCPENYHHCNDSTHDSCIPDRWKCDGNRDCDNGSDESNCTIIENCPGFKCLNQQCIPLRWKCDGVIDCDDKSDETDCETEPKSQLCLKHLGYFECKTGECIHNDKLCNKVKDCPKGDDEGSECNNKKIQSYKQTIKLLKIKAFLLP